MARHDADTRPDGIPVQRLLSESGQPKTGTEHRKIEPGMGGLPVQLRRRIATDRVKKVTVPKGMSSS